MILNSLKTQKRRKEKVQGKLVRRKMRTRKMNLLAKQRKRKIMTGRVRLTAEKSRRRRTMKQLLNQLKGMTSWTRTRRRKYLVEQKVNQVMASEIKVSDFISRHMKKYSEKRLLERCLKRGNICRRKMAPNVSLNQNV